MRDLDTIKRLNAAAIRHLARRDARPVDPPLTEDEVRRLARTAIIEFGVKNSAPGYSFVVGFLLGKGVDDRRATDIARAVLGWEEDEGEVVELDPRDVDPRD
jgi:hypothetical protein